MKMTHPGGLRDPSDFLMALEELPAALAGDPVKALADLWNKGNVNKLLEHVVVVPQLQWFLDVEDDLDPFQYGFRPSCGIEIHLGGCQ